MNLSKNTAIITGSTDGIGFSIAELLARQGINVVLNGRSEHKIQVAITKFKDMGLPKPLTVCGDINDKNVRSKIINETKAQFSKIDFLINNAGGGTPHRSIEEVSEELFQEIISSNLTSTFSMCKEVVPHMKSIGGGKIINISSLAGRDKSVLAGPHYSAAKAGVIGLTRHLAAELGKYNINVNAVCPGIVMTDRIRDRWNSKTKEEQSAILSQIPMGRLASPEEIAHAVLYLLSDHATYITGISLDINGGIYMN